MSRKVASRSTRARAPPRARWRSSPSVGPSAQCTSSSTSRIGPFLADARRRSATAVCRRWRIVSGSASDGWSPPRPRCRAAGAKSSPPVGPSAAPSASGVDLPCELVECLHERPVRRAHDRVAGAVEDEGAPAGRPRWRTRARAGSCPTPASPATSTIRRPSSAAAGSIVRSASSSFTRPTKGNADGRQSGPGSGTRDHSQI